MPPNAARKVERDVNDPGRTGQPFGATNNQSRYRKVTVDETTRPRDAAIRAARDTDRSTPVAQDIKPLSNYPTVDQEFRGTYVERGTGERIIAENASSPQNQLQRSIRQAATASRKVERQVSKGTESPKQLSGKGIPKNPRQAVMKVLPGGFKEGELKHIADRAYATQVTITIFPWAAGLWLAFQLPFALMAIVFFGLAGAIESAKQTFVGSVIAFATSALSSAIDAIFDVDLTQFNPENFFIVTNTVTMFIGFATLLAMGLVYTVAGIPSLSGKAAGLKYATLIVALAGYSMPVLNLFPWAILWALAVWFYPTD